MSPIIDSLYWIEFSLILKIVNVSVKKHIKLYGFLIVGILKTGKKLFISFYHQYLNHANRYIHAYLTVDENL